MIDCYPDPDSIPAPKQRVRARISPPQERPTRFEVTELSEFIQQARFRNPPPLPQTVIYGQPGVFVRLRPAKMSVVFAILANMIGRHTGGTAITVTMPSPAWAQVQFHEATLARTPSHAVGLSYEPLRGSRTQPLVSACGLAFAERVVAEHGGRIGFGFTGAWGLSATLHLPLRTRQTDNKGKLRDNPG